MKVFITQYALTRGIIESEAEIKNDMAIIKGRHYVYHPKPHWHLSEQLAKQQGEKMRIAKIASLQKQIDKLKNKYFL